MRQEVLRMERVTYIEHGITKLEDFRLQIYKGEIMGMIPVNGHGMNDFLKLLKTNLPIERGYIYYGNELVNSWKESKKNHNRVSIIEAKSGLVEGLTVSDNIFVLRHGFRQRLIRTGLLRKQLAPFLHDIGMDDISPDSCVEKLSVFQRVVVEILRAVILGHQLIVLNEIGTLISEKELQKLHRIIRKYAASGFSFLYISPHLEESAMICDRTALLSHGAIQKVIHGKEKSREIVAAYTEEYERVVRNHLAAQTNTSREREKVLSLRDITFGSISQLNFDIYAGECVTIQNMDHDVFKDIISLLTEDEQPQKGGIYVGTEKVKILGNNNISVIRELPTTSMIFQELDYMTNLCMGMTQRIPDIWYRHHIRESIFQECRPIVGEEVFYKPMEQLTQRQKYKLVYTRVLLQRPKVVFCIQPFKGTDLPHRMFVWQLLEMLLNRGIAVVILTMNLSDSISLSDRLLRLGSDGMLEEITRDNFDGLTEDVPWKYLYE